ncbi:hypothetical protein ACFOVU_07085 [Nocardiopsis sediminis]|uniref:Uncharacterized protein n=1 Tax=Nocardiopsis sediminis TaxID=1778267 RepID=A0ABV8FLX8_9ACTN
MSDYRHAQEAKRRVREQYGADPRVLGVGVRMEEGAGYGVEVLLESALDYTPPEVCPAELGGDPQDVPVRWRITGPITPL